MEYHIFTISGALKREILSIFQNLSSSLEINLVIFIQDTETNLFNDCSNEEKDICLLNFFHIAEKLFNSLTDYWSDYIDPSSGLSMKTDTQNFYSDIDGCSRLMKLDYTNFGGCMMMLHPKYGASFYPSTFITTAPVNIIQNQLEIILRAE